MTSSPFYRPKLTSIVFYWPLPTTIDHKLTYIDSYWLQVTIYWQLPTTTGHKLTTTDLHWLHLTSTRHQRTTWGKLTTTGQSWPTIDCISISIYITVHIDPHYDLANMHISMARGHLLYTPLITTYTQVCIMYMLCTVCISYIVECTLYTNTYFTLVHAYF